MKIYFDTEFSSLWDPQVISVGMTAEDGRELYVEVLHDERRNSKFTSEIVAPLLEGDAVGIGVAADRIRVFLQSFEPTPELVCDFIGDWWILRDMLPGLDDYARPRCSLQGAPDAAYENPRKRHHALADARALKAFKPALQQGTD